MRQTLKQILPVGQAAVDLLFPPICLWCGAAESDAERASTTPAPSSAAPPASPSATPHTSPALCADCVERLLEPRPSRCRRCGMPTSTDAPALPNGRCRACREDAFHFSAVVPLGDYVDELRDAVLAMKETTGRTLAIAIARLLAAEARATMESFQPDLIAAVPMHWWPRAWRGMNSAEIVAETLARELCIAWAPRLLIRHRYTAPQSDLPRTRRRTNVRNAFRVSRCYTLDRPRVLLVDDILTTGATCSEAARTLRDAGAADVFVAVVTRATSP
ncbi:MAG: ComF family protein [Planctomycetota bacterium]|nr:MAG: ComF family protein [Planctomycetota bacterium]